MSKTPADPRTRAVRYAWALLVVATLLSVAGNVSTAVAGGHGREAVAVAVVVPLMLAATVHLLALMVRAGVAGWAYRGVMGLTVVIAAAAFTLSFDALTRLAERTGHGVLAPLLPILIDASIAACTAALVVLDRPVVEVATATATATAAVPATVAANESAAPPATQTALAAEPVPATPATAAPAARKPTTARKPATRKPARTATRRALRSPGARAGTVAVDGPGAEAYQELAAQLVREGRVRSDVGTVAAALAGIAAGRSHRSVALETGLHRTVVAKVAERAASETEEGVAA